MVGRPEHCVRPLQIPALQLLPDFRTADSLPVQPHLGKSFHAEAALQREFPQHGSIPAPVVPEPVVLPDRDQPRVQLLHKNLPDKILRLHPACLPGDRIGNIAVNSCLGEQQLLFFLRVNKPEILLLLKHAGPEIKCKDNTLTAAAALFFLQ